MRLSFHPSTTTADIDHTMNAVAEVVRNARAWSLDYAYSNVTNEYAHRDGDHALTQRVHEWFAAASSIPAPTLP